MANDEISDIANNIGLGDNLGANAKLGETAYPGHLMKWATTEQVMKYPISTAGLANAGVLNTKEDHDLDASMASGLAINCLNEGWVSAWIDDPAGTKYEGTPLYRPKTAAGVFSFTASGAESPIAKLASEVASGDTVARIKLLRGG